MPFLLNKNSFCPPLQLTSFCIKTNLRENRFFVAGWRLVDEKGTHNVKFLTENETKGLCCIHAHGQRPRKARTLTTAKASGCRVCCSRPMETISWKRGSDTPLAASFLLVEKCIECYPSGSSLRHNHVLPQAKGAELYLCAVLRT